MTGQEPAHSMTGQTTMFPDTEQWAAQQTLDDLLGRIRVTDGSLCPQLMAVRVRGQLHDMVLCRHNIYVKPVFTYDIETFCSSPVWPKC